MKKIYALLYLVFGVSMAQNQNYVLSKTYKDSTKFPISVPTPANASQNITYFDGLGRPMQQIAIAKSPQGKSIISHIEYNNQLLKTKEYLPYTSATASADFRESAKDSTFKFYNKSDYDYTLNPYSQVSYDQSPLNRLMVQSSPGEDWLTHDVWHDYDVNHSYSNAVKRYTATAGPIVNGVYACSLAVDNYPLGTIAITILSDENQNSTREYRDSEGRIIIKSSYAGLQKLDTYYVYDQFGNLSFVIPPLSDGSGSQQDLDGLCYQYRYDGKNRLVEKKLPGKSWEYILYDKLDRVVATGPAPSPFSNFTNAGWLATKYDAFNRPVLTCWVTTAANSSTRNALQNAINSPNSYSNEKRSTPVVVNGVSIPYSNDAWPKIFHPLTVNYYDSYDFPGVPQALPASLMPDGSQPVYYNRTVKPIGLATGSWIRTVETSSVANGESSYVLYDKKGRPVRTCKSNYLGGFTQTDSRIDFSGKTLYTITEHKRTASAAPLTIREDFAYSDQDRLLTHTHQINGGPVHLLAKNGYDEMGQLVRKGVGNLATLNPLQQVDYKYNIRGWLKEINTTDNLLNPADPSDPRDLFSFKINYNDATVAQPLFNGNISETLWRTASDNVLRKYAYGYDELNRLTSATYLKPGAVPVPNSYGESLSYDKNGNITTLDRYGEFDDGVVALKIDGLGYHYEPSSNRLARVTDATNNPNGFKDDSDGTNDSADDYGYDAYGNMVRDDNKGISSISYNHLHLPVKIVMAGGNIEYLYDAAGVKLKKTVTEPGRPVKTQDYLSGFIYSNGVLELFPTAEGYVKNTAVSGADRFNYVYNYTDHLGNVRVSYGQDPVTQAVKILEENNYYPFGLKHKNYNMSQKNYIKTNGGVSLDPICVNCAVPFKYNYKYQGQERQDELGLNWDSFKWRNYDYTIGRFFNVDPLAEKYPYNSTYAFQENKMGMGVELEGLELAPRNPVSGFGNYVKGKFDSAVSSIQTTTAKAVQAVSNAISSLEINQVDGYNLSGSKSGVAGSTGFFNEAKGATASGTLDGETLSTLSDLYGPDFSGVPEGTQFIVDIYQTFFDGGESSSSSSSGTSSEQSSSSSSGEKTVEINSKKFVATDPIRGNASQVHAFTKKTTVNKSSLDSVKSAHTKDSLKAVKDEKKKNEDYNSNRGY